MDAKLSTIKGIGGTLNSSGSFGGVLERIKVTGTTTTPDFQLDLARQPVNLDTRFRAVVDGTSGDTYLEEVDATLGQSHILAKGSVAGAPGAKGRTIALDVKADGRFEDFLRLAVKAQRPPMRGGINLATSLVIPPGEIDVAQRIQLKGSFKIRRGQFTSDIVQDKVDELSRRGRGEPENDRVQNVLADFGGDFSLQNGRLGLPKFEFSVEGARVALGGSLWPSHAAARLRGSAVARCADLENNYRFQVSAVESVRPALPQTGRRNDAPDRCDWHSQSTVLRARQGPPHRPVRFGTRQRGHEERGRRAVSPALENVSLIETGKPVRRWSVEVVQRVRAKSMVECGCEKRMMTGVRITAMTDGERSVDTSELGHISVVMLGTFEERHQILVSPARVPECPPCVEAVAMPANVHHRIDGARPAVDFPARHADASLVQPRLRLCRGICRKTIDDQRRSSPSLRLIDPLRRRR